MEEPASNILISSQTDIVDPEQLRQRVRDVTRDFKNSWRSLAQALHIVWQEKFFKQWGYETFDQYTAKEVHVRKHTAMKLIRSYQFLHQEESPASDDQDRRDLRGNESPSYEAVSTLQRAKKSLDEQEYKKIKNDLLVEEKDLGEVKKDLTALIMRRRKDLDPEAERTRVQRASVGRFIASLRNFQKDIETLSVLPQRVAADIQNLIQTIEAFVQDR